MPGPSTGFRVKEFFSALWQDIVDQFNPAPVGQIVQPCGKQIDNIPSRAARAAFQKDAAGHIVGEPVGQPFLTSHGGFIDPSTGQPSTYFVAQNYELRLENGRTVNAMKSLGQWDQNNHVIIPDARMDTDCHGLTFTNGEYWINDDEVDKILVNGGYNLTDHPQPGDILVYRDTNGSVVHSLTVTQANAAGNVTEVSGLGGIEPAEHTNTPDTGWGDPSATKEYYNR